MDANKMREQFEVAFARYAAMSVEEVRAHWDGDFYDEQGMRDAIWAWEESRKVLEVELPKFDGYKEHIVRELQAAFTAAIEAQGLKVAP